MTWATKRKLSYMLVVIAFIGATGFLIIYPKYYNQAPSCTDNTQNGNETGVDCGGSCLLACPAEVNAISILWSRSFRVLPGRYNAVAYINNQNKNTAIYQIKYRFRFADQNNVYIGKREGTTFIPPTGHSAIFEGAIDMGNSVPIYTTFEFTETPTWIQVPSDKVNQLKVFPSNINLQDATTSPRLSATVKNNSLFTIPEVSFVAILYDESHNAISASRTFVDELKGEESANINFTWPEPIGGSTIATEIIPMYDVFLATLK